MIKSNGRRVVICDFPSRFLFPPEGYGGIERWLWTVAKKTYELGYEVILSGPLWRSQLLPGTIHYKKRINQKTKKEFLSRYGKVDFLIGGHEYWSNPTLNKIFLEVSKINMSYQLFCFSQEMMERFRVQSPHKLNIFCEGFQEEPIIAKDEGYLVWVGRLDEDKAPHYAIMAAKEVNMPIYIIGKTRYQPSYFRRYKKFFSMRHVKLLGEISGKKKMMVIGGASCAIYTLSKTYIESAGMIFPEYLRSGIPIAGITWKGNDSIVEAIGKYNEGGCVNKVKMSINDKEVSSALVKAIHSCLGINRKAVLRYGEKSYDPIKLTKEMIRIAEEG